MELDSTFVDEIGGGVAGGLAGGLAAFGLMWLQRHFDRRLQSTQQEYETAVSRESEVVSGVLALWSVASQVILISGLLSRRVVVTWRWGVLVGVQVIVSQRLAGELAAAYTRLFISADDDVLFCARRVVEASEFAMSSAGVPRWWQPSKVRRQRKNLDEAHGHLTEALHDLREMTRSRLGRELPVLPAAVGHHRGA